MNDKLIIKSQTNTKERIDVFLSQHTGFTRSKIQNLIKLGFIKNITTASVVNSSSYKVICGEEYEIMNDIIPQNHLIAKKMDIEIIYEDDDLLIVNKPAFLTVHPGAGNYENTLVNGLLYNYKNKLSSIGGDLRLGIVHRIDKDTSGLLVIAKNDETHLALSEQFADHSITRKYRCLVWGVPLIKSGKIENFIQRSDKNRLKMATNKVNGKKAITHYKIINFYQDLISLVDVELFTGRTHQIRLHMLELGYPLVGEKLYSKNSTIGKLNKLSIDIQNVINSLNRQSLHAYKLGFTHPKTSKYIEFIQEEPLELLEIYNLLNFKI